MTLTRYPKVKIIEEVSSNVKIYQYKLFKVYLILTVQLQNPLDLPLYQTFSQVLAKNNKIIDFKQNNKISFLKV